MSKEKLQVLTPENSQVTFIDLEFPRFRGHPMSIKGGCPDGANEEPLSAGIS